MAGLHVLPDGSGCGCLIGAGVPREQAVSLSWPAQLGPILPIDSLDAWAKERSESPFASPRDAIFLRQHLVDLWASLSGRDIHLWFSDSVGDQLDLAWLAAFITLHDVRPTNQFRMRVQHIDCPATRPLRDVSPTTLLDSDVLSVPHSPLDHFRLWTALTATTPDGLNALLSDADVSGAVRRAAMWHARRFPSADTGLSHWDSMVLKSVADSGPALASIALRLTELLGPDDALQLHNLRQHIDRLASGQAPLLNVQVRAQAGPLFGHSFDGSASLTDLGVAALSVPDVAFASQLHKVGGIQLGPDQPWCFDGVAVVERPFC